MTQDSTCVTFIGKVVCICLRVSVNLVYKFQGKPGTTTVKHDFNPNGLKFHRGSPWVSILSWLNLKANKDYFSYEHDWFQSCHTYRDRYEVSCIRLFRKCASMSVCETWLIHMCDMTHSNVWHDSRLYICDMTYSNVRCKWIFRTCTSMSTCETWLIHMCNMTHSYVWHDSFIRVTRLIHMCDMTHSYVWHDSFIRVTRLTTLHSWHDLFRGIRDTTCSEAFVTRLVQRHSWHDLFRGMPYAAYGCSGHARQCQSVRRDSFTRVTWLMTLLVTSLIHTYAANKCFGHARPCQPEVS